MAETITGYCNLRENLNKIELTKEKPLLCRLSNKEAEPTIYIIFEYKALTNWRVQTMTLTKPRDEFPKINLICRLRELLEQTAIFDYTDMKVQLTEGFSVKPQTHISK